ncbi:MAG: hypothetical protein ABIN04_16095, partial [Ginsengibacter sp.]
MTDTKKAPLPGSANQKREKSEGNELTFNNLKKPAPILSLEDFTGRKDLKNNSENQFQNHKDILKNLLSELQPLDFVSIIKPEAANLMQERNAIIEAYESGNKELHKKLNEPKGGEASRMLEIELRLKVLHKEIKQRHYVVSIISELLKVAANSKWNLCQCYDYVYVYNGAFWKQLSKD